MHVGSDTAQSTAIPYNSYMISFLLSPFIPLSSFQPDMS